ncbi:multidrug effflux MFS transporter [Streptomyces sp. 4N509B]|uniref:multidrug effflux MFS transporter n=1 Tax=Streptomyces sp. 4N509B TaxID=3457413 RepID=UPI003FCEF06C
MSQPGPSGQPTVPPPTASPTAPPRRPSEAASRTPDPGPQPSHRQRAGLVLTLLLGSLTAITPISIDLYLPALPEIGDSLHTGAATIQLTLTACMLGLGLGQLVVGPMSDQLGRRRPLLVGMACYVVASVACALAPTAETLIVFRLLQGLAGAAGVVIARAVVRDLFDGLAMARFFSTLLLISGIAPILAPVFGAQLMRVTDWRGLFVALAVAGVVLLAVTARWLPETLPPRHRDGGGVPTALRTMGRLFGDRVFTGHLLAGSLTFAALFAYVAASPFVVQEIHDASPQTFSLLFMTNAIGLIVMGQVNGRILVGRVSLNRIMAAGLLLTALAAAALLVMTSGLVGDVGLLPVATGLFLLMVAMPLVLPNANTQGLLRTPHAAGSASALLGSSQFFVGAVASPLVGVAGEDTAVPMAVVQLTVILLAAASFLALCRPWRPAPPRPADWTPPADTVVRRGPATHGGAASDA